MADYREPRTLGSTPGTSGTATHSTETSTTGTSGIVGKVKEQATAQLASQKTKATDGLGTVAEAVRETTKHLRDGQHDTVARYAEQAADQIERFSQRLRDKDVGELMNDAQQLARRQPALFVGGAFAIGLLGARFLKSSSPESRGSYGGSYGGNYGGGAYGTTGYGGTTDYTRNQGLGARNVPNAYGNTVPSSARTASTASNTTDSTSTNRDYKPTEGL